MLHVTLLLEDTTIVASRDDKNWRGLIADNLTGRSEQIVWSDSQFGAILALAIGGETMPLEETSHILYSIAESAVANLSKELRPIP